MRSTRWIIAPPVPRATLAQFAELPPLVVQILYNRGIRTRAEAEEFLHPDSAGGNPFQLPDMNKAVARLRRAIAQGEPIIVYGDYDVDGITATALLVQLLEALGARVRPYIPHRVEEGYGLNMAAMKRLSSLGGKVLLTVDCGTRSVEEVAYARRLGMDVIITDHHSPGEQMPAAYAIVNPRQGERKYPFVDLAGVGLAFKLAQALLRVEGQLPVRASKDSPLPTEEEFLDLVALGTVADVAPLLGENRSLVWKGLQRLNETARVGLRAMFAEAGVTPGNITTTTIGYILGPRLNAAGRLSTALSSYKLLMASDAAEAEKLAHELGAQNRERQRITEELLLRAEERITAEGLQNILIVYGEEYVAGVAGLVAARLTQKYYRPSVVIELGEHESKGSARSIPEFHITRALDKCAALLTRHGGHAQAAGFTLASERVPELVAQLRQIAAEELAPEDLVPRIDIDAEVPLSQADWATAAMLKDLAPFGHCNPEPILASRNVLVRRFRLVGDGHLQLTLSDGRVVWDAIAFGQGEWANDMPERVDVAYSIGTEDWNGQKNLKLYVQDLRPALS